MANAFVDNLKTFGLKHGEKVGVGLASAIFFGCVAIAARLEPIALTPDQVKKAATATESNLARREDRDAIIKRLEDTDKIVDTNFAGTVNEMVKTALVADDYKPARGWVSPEPGAGLIRDQPKLIAPSDLYAYPGRGGFLVFELDSEGNRIPDTDPKPAPTITKSRKRRSAPRGGMGMGGMGGARRRPRSNVKAVEQAKENAKFEAKSNIAKLTPGSDDEEPDTKSAADDKNAPKVPEKETNKGFRWVAITGTLDHAQMLANYREALKNPAIANPHYARVDLQRKTLNPDGTWTDWEKVDTDENLNILDNLPELDSEELTPESVRPEGLVDQLPFLTAGLWEKVHIASLVPKERKEALTASIEALNNPASNAARPMGAMDGGGRGQRGMMRGGMGGAGGGMGVMGGGGMGVMGGGSMAGMMGGEGRGMGRGRGAMGMGMGMGMGATMSGAPEAMANYWKSDAKKVMIRALDFTVKPDSTYRYRACIVVFNPNFKREDVSPGTDKTSKTLKGPWSGETEVVSMPPDIMPYAMGVLPPNPKGDMKVKFEVVRFHPEDGVTVPKFFEAGPGEILGEPRTADVPVSDGTGKKAKLIDFNSHQIVLDVEGGFVQLPRGILGPPVDRPALALVLRPDGSAVIHNQADDLPNEFRKDVRATYRHELDQSSKERRNSMGSGYAGMMGGGMMGGGMMGGGGGPR